jgi:hypothetical protein
MRAGINHEGFNPQWTWVTPYGAWSQLGKGVDSDVCALTLYKKNLYAGGKFDSAGGIAASHIARWDTVALTWDSLLGKLNGNVYALCVYHGNLYVGGDFTIAGGDTVNRIAMWNGSVWAAVSKGFDTGAVYALTVGNDTLYAGGSFLKSNGVVLNHVAKLSSNTWKSLGVGTNNTVYALAGIHSELYVGGAFTQSGGKSTRYISRFFYYSQSWDTIGADVNDTVRAIDNGNGCFSCPLKMPVTDQVTGGGNSIIIGGNFDSAFGRSCHYITTLPFLGWSAGDVNGPVYSITNPYSEYSLTGDNYIGGKFSKGNNYFNAETLNYVAYCGLEFFEGIQNIFDKSNIDIYPNPNNGKFTVDYHSEQSEESQKIEIYNILGEKVVTESLRSSQSDISINLTGEPNGIYFYRVITETGQLIGQGKLIIQK